MRRIMALAAALLLVATATAQADCKIRPIGQSEQAYADLLSRRLRPLGVKEIDAIGHSDGRDHLVAIGADFSLFLTPEDDLIHEIGFVLTEPAKSSETEKLMTAVAFTLSNLGGVEETGIKNRLYDDLATHSTGTWSERAGPAIAFLTRMNGALVVKMGLVSCS